MKKVRPDVREELEHHVQERIDHLIARGWDPEAAKAEARERFGDMDRIRHDVVAVDDDPRDGGEGRAASMARLLGDALRGLKGAPGLVAAVVLLLGLAVGASSATFSVIDAFALRPFQFRAVDRLMEVETQFLRGEERAWTLGVEPGALEGWRSATTDFVEGWVAWDRETLMRTDVELPEAMHVLALSPGADTLLGIPLHLGRGIRAEDARPGAPAVAVLSREAWERMGGERDLVGGTITLESTPVTVIGVLRGGIRFPAQSSAPDLWLPLRDDGSWLDREPGWLRWVWLRLAPGVGFAEAHERFAAVGQGMEAAQPGTVRGVQLGAVAEHEVQERFVRPLLTLAGTVLLLYLIALTNAANLILVGFSSRERAMSIRRALGCPRRRLLAQVTIEGMILGLLGGVAAAGVAWLALEGIRGMLPSSLTFFTRHAFVVEDRTLLFTFAGAAATGWALGLVPAGMLLRGAGATLSSAGSGLDETRGRRRMRNALVVGQIALSMVLLAGAGLLTRSFTLLLAEDPGFEVERVAHLQIQWSRVRYADAAARLDAERRVEAWLEARPEVDGVAKESSLLKFGTAIQAEGSEVLADQPAIVPAVYASPDWFDVRGVHLVAGRPLNAGDAGADNVVIDRDMAQWIWGTDRVVGRRFRSEADEPWLTVVGVARDLRLEGRDQRQGPNQIVYAAAPDQSPGVVTFSVRTAGDTEALVPLMRRAVAAVDPAQWIWRAETAERTLAEQEDMPRFMLLLLNALASLSLVLAAAGLFAVLSYAVGRRKREMGIRVALGAGTSRVRGMVLAEGLRMALVGVALGAALFMLAAGLFEGLVYGVGSRDIGALVAAAVVLTTVALAASFEPARRATRVDPRQTLNAE